MQLAVTIGSAVGSILAQCNFCVESAQTPKIMRSPLGLHKVLVDSIGLREVLVDSIGLRTVRIGLARIRGGV